MMPGYVLTTASTVMCTHGGQALLMTSNNNVVIDGAPALLESDIHTVVGCSFTVGPKYSPCIRVEWSSGTKRTETDEVSFLVKTSIGKCINAEGATQGIANIVSTQLKVNAQ